MFRQLPPTLTADQTPEWLPAGWVSHTTVLKRGRQKSTYTNLRNGKTFSTKDQVLQYIKMEKIREEREYGIERRKGWKASLKAFQDTETSVERPLWLPDDWEMEVRIGAFGGNQYKMYVNPLTGFKTHLKEKVLSYQYTVESQGSSSGEEEEELGCNHISYMIDESEEDFSENEYFEDRRSRENVELREQPERMQKLESRAKTQCVFEDEEDMSSDSEAKISKEENASGEKNLHDSVIECGDNAREISGLRGSLSIELNLESEPASDSLVEKDFNESGNEGIGTRNVEVRDQDSDLMDISASSKVVEVTQEPGDKSEEQNHPEESADEARRSVFFPSREAPSHSVLQFENPKAKSSADDLINTIELDLNLCADTLQEKNICSGSKKRKKSAKPCSSKNIEKNDTEAPTDKHQKGKKTPRKPQGKKESSSVVMKKKPIDWPKPCPYFPFEPLKTPSWVEDDSVIRKYLEEYYTAAGSADGDLPLPDFGLPTFANIKVSEPDDSKKKKPLDTPCVQVASSSLPSCSSTGTTTMQPTIAGN